MLIKDQLVEDGSKVYHVRSYDYEWALDDVKNLRHVEPQGDWWHVGHIPQSLMAIWIKEAGLQWSDTEAVADLVRKKLLSGEYANLRPVEKSF